MNDEDIFVRLRQVAEEKISSTHPVPASVPNGTAPASTSRIEDLFKVVAPTESEPGDASNARARPGSPCS